LSICQLHISLNRTAQIYLELHFCVELHTKKALGSCAYRKLPMYSLNARDHFNCSPPFSHDQHHKTDAAKRKGGAEKDARICIEHGPRFCKSDTRYRLLPTVKHFSNSVHSVRFASAHVSRCGLCKGQPINHNSAYQWHFGHAVRRRYYPINA